MNRLAIKNSGVLAVKKLSKMINTYLPSKLAEMESDILIHNMEMEMNGAHSVEAFNINDLQLESLLEWKLAICN